MMTDATIRDALLFCLTIVKIVDAGQLVDFVQFNVRKCSKTASAIGKDMVVNIVQSVMDK